MFFSIADCILKIALEKALVFLDLYGFFDGNFHGGSPCSLIKGMFWDPSI